ncbi:hypothetical protein RGV33_16125 [Pseudomonas sp. Bout1]|uniref:hypothetical protein n=1 Tax=Pseudomonas sp. Bout1 TaxID=3048600 RepID=UPI002AB5C543|nr:hypothetical protein [Pseudomonas sp. Bout1]MDY7533193.1 hypothetical protein [Pseudomonas sp. Bout1]MEB0183758.1 hypothetical protein [Pseudomonas sp. Bout1]
MPLTFVCQPPAVTPRKPAAGDAGRENKYQVKTQRHERDNKKCRKPYFPMVHDAFPTRGGITSVSFVAKYGGAFLRKY